MRTLILIMLFALSSTFSYAQVNSLQSSDPNISQVSSGGEHRYMPGKVPAVDGTGNTNCVGCYHPHSLNVQLGATTNNLPTNQAPDNYQGGTN